MSFILPADWLSWSLGGGLSLILLWLISVPPARGGMDDIMTGHDVGRAARARGPIT